MNQPSPSYFTPTRIVLLLSIAVLAVAGGLLLGAVRCAVTGGDPVWILLLVTASFPAHLYDLRRRARVR